MAAILAHVIGIKMAVPVMTIALILSHFSRAVMYARETDWKIAKHVLIFGCPMIAIGAFIFGRISPATIAIVFAVFLALSFPIKYWASRHNIQAGPTTLAAASGVWGMLAGNVIGPSFFLAPFLLGTGMNPLTFVGTLATVTLAMNLLKATVFGATGLLDHQVLTLGVAIGLLTIPGNWIGRSILTRLKERDHRIAIDLLTGIMILNFVYLAAETS